MILGFLGLMELAKLYNPLVIGCLMFLKIENVFLTASVQLSCEETRMI